MEYYKSELSLCIWERVKKYSADDLNTAIDAVNTAVLTLHGASRKYGIPTSTLHDLTSGKTGSKNESLGRSLAIALEQEAMLADGLRSLEFSRGF